MVTFSTNEVSQMLGISPRMLQWWDEKGVVSPRHHRHERLYEPLDVVEAAIVAELRMREVSLQQARRIFKKIYNQAARFITADGQWNLPNGNVMAVFDAEPRQLSSVFVTEDAEAICKILMTKQRPQFVISLSDIIVRVRKAERMKERG